MVTADCGLKREAVPLRGGLGGETSEPYIYMSRPAVLSDMRCAGMQYEAEKGRKSAPCWSSYLEGWDNGEWKRQME